MVTGVITVQSAAQIKIRQGDYEVCLLFVKEEILDNFFRKEHSRNV